MADLIRDTRLDPTAVFLDSDCAGGTVGDSCLDSAGFRPLSKGRALLREAGARLSLVERCGLHWSSSEEDDILDTLSNYMAIWLRLSPHFFPCSLNASLPAG